MSYERVHTHHESSKKKLVGSDDFFFLSFQKKVFLRHHEKKKKTKKEDEDKKKTISASNLFESPGHYYVVNWANVCACVGVQATANAVHVDGQDQPYSLTNQ